MELAHPAGAGAPRPAPRSRPGGGARSLPAGGALAGLLALLVAVPALAGTRAARASMDGAPPGHTGGFGEPTCHACHADGPPPVAGGVRLEGLPAGGFTPGTIYTLAVVLERTPTRAAGFQLAVRHAPGATDAGRQAGRLEAADARTRVRVGQDSVQYLTHTFDGILQAEAGSARWAFLWTAPEAGTDVVVHAAANFASDDASELGDTIRTGHWRVPAATPGAGLSPPPRLR